MPDNPTNKRTTARKGLRGNMHNSMIIEQVPLCQLKSNPKSPRIFKDIDDRTAERVLEVRDFIPPLAIEDDGTVILGEIYFRAARKLGWESLPAIRIGDVTEAVALEMAIAYQRLNELGSWDHNQLGLLNIRFEAEIPDYRVEHIGFEVGQMDVFLDKNREEDEEDLDGLASDIVVSKVGDLWLLGKHRLICADSTDPSTFARLMAGTGSAAMVFSDPPFGCAINGFVAKEGKHREFVTGSNDMNPAQLLIFFTDFIKAMLPHVKAGAVVEIVIDWRSLHTLLDAAAPLLGPLINMAIWAKDRPGQGGFLRSQYELILIFKKGKGRFRNNVQLGRHGRNRSNLWKYPSAKTASTGSDEGDMLKHHPTPKGVRMVADALLDCTRRGEIVLEAFSGSGTTLIASDKIGRICHAAELDPAYVDLAIRRWQAWSGEQAIHQPSGRTFDEIEAELIPNN